MFVPGRMAKTYTPELDPAARSRRAAYAARFRDACALDRPARWCPVSLRGRITDGERTRIEPLSRRVTRPPEWAVTGPEQARQQFVSQSSCEEQAVGTRHRALGAEAFADPKGVFVSDDTTVPKQGKHSVGVPRPRCGVLGPKAHCQGVVSVPSVSPKGHGPREPRLDRPASGLGDQTRRDRAGVPEPERRSRTTGPSAWERLDRVRGEGLPGGVVRADAGSGVSGPFRDGLTRRGWPSVVGVTDARVVVTAPPPVGRGLPPTGEPEGSGGADTAAEGDLA
jgi:SRSO17 transposase